MLKIQYRGNYLHLYLFLMGWPLRPNELRPFKIYCAPPNLGITRTWICKLNYAQRPIFSGLRFFNEPESQTRGSQLKVSPGGLMLRIFMSWKNPSTSAGFEPANLGSRDEHVTPRPPRPTSNKLTPGNKLGTLCLHFYIFFYQFYPLSSS